MSWDPRLKILHADMDAFFAAVEVLDDPSLAGKPVVVGHPGRRGVVSTASYEARKFGVHSALPSAVAKRRCPQAIWRSPRPQRYGELSKQIRDIFLDYTPEVEPLSLDEAFLDVEGSLRLFGGAHKIAEEIRRRVKNETGGLTVSIGIAENMFLAKLASDLDKPDGVTVVPAGQAEEFLAPLPIERLWGVGKKTAAVLHNLGLKKIEDIVRFGLEPLKRQLGPASGHHLWTLAHGRDLRRVTTDHSARSVSTESTFAEDVYDREKIDRFIFQASENVAATLRNSGLRARTVQLKVRTGSFRTMTRSRTLDRPTNISADFFKTALELFNERVELQGEGIRLLGVGGQGLEKADRPVQGSLFDAPEEDAVTDRLVDQIRESLGRGAIQKGRLVRKPGESDEHNPGDQDPGRIRRSDL